MVEYHQNGKVRESMPNCRKFSDSFLKKAQGKKIIFPEVLGLKCKFRTLGVK